MNNLKFIELIQGYYNLEYADITLEFLLGYIERLDIDLKILFEKTIKTFSGQYRSLPDIAIFEAMIKTIKSENDNDLNIDNDYDPTGRLAREKAENNGL